MNTDTIALLDKYFDLAITAPDGIKRLRETILTLAMQGKLVPQDPKDQPASELLKEIETEKQRLVKEGKIKEPKALPPIMPKEVPYEVPKSWEWVRLGVISEYIQRGKGPTYSDEKKYPVISQKCVQWSGFDNAVVKFVDPSSIHDYSEERFIISNDLLWNSTGTGTIGRIGIYKDELSEYSKIVADSHVTVIRVLNLDPVYILQFLKSPLIQNAIEGMASGTTNQIELNTSTVIEQIAPLPPLTEQRRIVAKIDELMARVDELERKRDALNERRLAMHQAAVARLLNSGDANASRAGRDFIFAHFGELYGTKENVAELRKAILQLAVMGRLVPQDPQDQMVSELLKEIEAEKKRLVQEGKIKEPKPLPAIKPEEVPYQVPKGWEWVRLGDVIELISGQHLLPSEYNENKNGFSYLTGPADFGYMNPIASRWTTVERAIALHDDILLTVKGAGVGKTNVLAELKAAISRQLMAIRVILINQQFMKFYLESNFTRLQELAVGIAIPGISREDVTFSLYPLPPLAEQKRITAKVDELMGLCDTLEKKIDERTTKESALLEAVAARV